MTPSTDPSAPQIHPSLRKQTLETSDIYAESIHFGSRHPRKAYYIMIPGNPGLNRFYIPFLSMLLENLLTPSENPADNGDSVTNTAPMFTDVEDIQLASISLAGHWTGKPASASTRKHFDKMYDLDAQVDYFVSILREFYLPDSGKDIYLSGHSIGAYILTRVVAKLSATEQTRIKRCFLLCPAVQKLSDSPNGKRAWLRALTYNKYYATNIVEWAFHFWNTLLPYSFREWFFRKLHGSTPALDPVIEEIHSAFLLGNIIRLTESEFAQVKQLQKDVFQDLPHRFVFFFSDCDEWVPMQYVDEIQNDLKDLQKDIHVLNVKHAFCIYEGNNELIASEVSKYILGVKQ